MASAALIVKDDGSFEATPEVMEVLHMQPGTRLELEEREGHEVRFCARPGRRILRAGVLREACWPTQPST